MVAYVKQQADGNCELCRQPAPFRKENGEPFLEVHHVVPLTSGGPDTPSNAVALCPNCHRECHHGANSSKLTVQLYQLVPRLEPPGKARM